MREPHRRPRDIPLGLSLSIAIVAYAVMWSILAATAGLVVAPLLFELTASLGR